jgi:SAM-dependent methyltransferase
MSTFVNENSKLDIAVPKSITHEHMHGVILSEITSCSSDTSIIRILDVGCGNGDLIIYLSRNISKIQSDIKFEIYGLDVVDYGVQDIGYEEKVLSSLEQFDNSVNWKNRVRFITTNDDWPFKCDYFNIVISNQVLEHVQNITHFFRQQNLVLKDKGVAIHLFPLKEVFYEGHLYLYFAHWFKNWDALALWIRLCSMFHLGKYKKSGMDIDNYVAGHADYINLYTNYLTENEILNESKRSGFRTSFSYTLDFYLRKFRNILRLNNRIYSNKYYFYDYFMFKLLKRVSSITLYQSKTNDYTRFE